MEQEKFRQMAEIVQKVLQKQKEVLFAYVFGSAAYGDMIRKSDVDVAIFLSPEYRNRFFDIRLLLMQSLTLALSQEADVLLLNTASPFLKYVVLKEGKLVFEHNQEARIDFELKSLNEYFDYKPVLKRYHNRLRSSV